MSEQQAEANDDEEHSSNSQGPDGKQNTLFPFMLLCAFECHYCCGMGCLVSATAICSQRREGIEEEDGWDVDPSKERVNVIEMYCRCASLHVVGQARGNVDETNPLHSFPQVLISASIFAWQRHAADTGGQALFDRPLYAQAVHSYLRVNTSGLIPQTIFVTCVTVVGQLSCASGSRFPNRPPLARPSHALQWGRAR